METDERVARVHAAIKTAQNALAATQGLLSGIVQDRDVLTPIIQAKIALLNDAVEEARKQAETLANDQSRWGVYKSHPSGNNN